MPIKKTALIISPQASREGHGAFHGQRTLGAFSENNDWQIIFLTGKGFLERSGGVPADCKVIEADVDLNKIAIKRHSLLDDIRWGIRRSYLSYRLLKRVDKIISSQEIDVVLFLDGDIFTIFNCWHRNRFKYPKVAWIAAHSTLDFSLSTFSVRSIYKWVSAKLVKIMTEKMDSTILYTGEKIKQSFCHNLKISDEAAMRIILARFGSDSEDMRLPIHLAREKLGLPINAKIALFFGLIRSDKRPDIAIDAISKSNNDWWLLLAGKPFSYDEKEIESWITNKGINNRCQLVLKYLSEEEVKTVFSAADILLLPHDRPLLSSSGPLSMALSYRLPVLAGDVGYLGDSVRRDGIGFVAKRGDSESFAQKLDEFARFDSVRIRQMREHIGEIVKENSFDITRDSYIISFNVAISHLKNNAYFS